jgi:hypothetical protein
VNCDCTCDTTGRFYMCNAHKAVIDAAKAWCSYNEWDRPFQVERNLHAAVRALDQ